MTKKDYERLAAAIREARASERARQVRETTTAMDGIDTVVWELCQTLADENAQFDARKFNEACGRG